MELIAAALGLFAIIAAPCAVLALIFKPLIENIFVMDKHAMAIWKRLKDEICSGKHDREIRTVMAIETKVDMEYDNGCLSTHFDPRGFGEYRHAYFRHPGISPKQGAIIAKRAHSMLLGRMR